MSKTVVAGVLRRDGCLLICQRRADADFAGKWEFPGGKVEPGEEPQPALRRELWEELGIQAEELQEIWRTEHQYAYRAPLKLIFFAVHQFQGEPQNLAFQQICWVPSDQLHGYDFLEADLPLIDILSAQS